MTLEGRLCDRSRKELSKSFPGVQALRHVDLSIHAGEVHALVGQNGAGKSTLIKIMAGAFGPSEGALLVRGSPVHFSAPLDAIRSGIVTISQEINLVPTLSAAENVFIGRLPRRRGNRVDWQAMRAETTRLLRDIGFDFDPGIMAADLSVAQQQGVEIARATSRDADIVIMDEPTSALAAHEVARLMEIVGRLKARGKTIIYVSHRFDEVFRIADRISVFREGARVATLDATSTDQDFLVKLMIGRVMTSPKAKPPRDRPLSRSDPQGGTDHPPRRLRRRLVQPLQGRNSRPQRIDRFGSNRDRKGDLRRRSAGGGADPGRRQQVSNPRPDTMVALGLALAPEDRKRHGLVLPMSVLDNLSLASLARRSGLLIRKFRTEIRAGRDHVKDMSIRTPRLSAPVAICWVGISKGGDRQVA